MVPFLLLIIIYSNLLRAEIVSSERQGGEKNKWEDKRLDGVPKLYKSSGYDRSRMPHDADGLLRVEAELNLRNIMRVDEREKMISLEVTLRLFWVDKRVHLNPVIPLENCDTDGSYVVLHPSTADSLWIPDLFIDMAKEIRSPTIRFPTSSVRLYNNSLIRFAKRFNFDVSCQMDFHKYPVDKQICDIHFESFSLTDKELKLRWRPTGNNINNITLDQFTHRVNIKESYTTNSYRQKFAGLQFTLYLRRNIYYHLVQTYIPSLLLVLLSWGSMFVNSSAPARIGIGMTALLSLISMFGHTRSMVPHTCYVSYLDGWMLFCIVLVFFCIMEFIVNHCILATYNTRIADRVSWWTRCVGAPVCIVVFNLVYWLLLIEHHLTEHHFEQTFQKSTPINCTVD